jgi:hypothetical protein
MEWDVIPVALQICRRLWRQLQVVRSNEAGFRPRLTIRRGDVLSSE